MENQYRNPDKNYSVWDGVLYEIARYQQGLTLLLNCSCNDCEMDGQRIRSVTGWQMTTQQFHRVEAAIFADCSGDSVLAPLTGAEYRLGREARDEFDEDIAPAEADRKTMGMSCLLQAREEDRPSEFIPPRWAYHYTYDDLAPYRVPSIDEKGSGNFWFLEIGGDQDSITDTEDLRDELLKIAYGIWDYMKNAPQNKEKYSHWRLDWMGILPGKRESRRYVGDHIITQNDVRAGGHFDDLAAYGGWAMDDHHPGGFKSREKPTIFHPAPSPYGIPYRAMYSVNISNLMFAGRNISATHTAMSSTRLIATCAVIGQAVGTAAAIAIRGKCTPRDIYRDHMQDLQQTLMEDDCYLPFLHRQVPDATLEAELLCGAESAENLRNGIDRPIGDEDNGCFLEKGQPVTYRFPKSTLVSRVRIIFDSDLMRETLPPKLGQNMLSNRPLHRPDAHVPTTMTRAFRVEGMKSDGSKVVLAEETKHYHRLWIHRIQADLTQITFIPLETWGARQCHVFSFDVR